MHKITWRRLHSDSKKVTYKGNQRTNQKSRLDRIYVVCSSIAPRSQPCGTI
jgi:hypothetical protein